jgi:hypothetical protein
MSCYINASQERLYGAIEGEYGRAASLQASHRISFRSLKVTERTIRSERNDKTGSRTRSAPHPAVRKDNRFELACYFSARGAANDPDGVMGLVQAALGGDVAELGGLQVTGVAGNPPTVTFAGAHGLRVGQALRFQGELRFVKAVNSANSVTLSAPFGTGLQAGATAGNTVTCWPGDKPKPFTLGNYWTPAGSIDRILAGCVINELAVTLNSDFHGALFRGTAREVVSATGFDAGDTGLTAFPAEPAMTLQDRRLVPGHVGRLFIGGVEYFLLDLALRFVNNSDTVTREFGMETASCYSADVRSVSVQFQLYASDHTAVSQLHALARSRGETDLSIQMGDTPGELVGIYIPRFMPEIPELKDADTHVVMSYPSSLVFGVTNDEISIAFA